MKVRQGLTFDDVLLIPRYSEVLTRNMPLDVDLGKGVKLALPVVSANMKNVTGKRMASAIAMAGGLPILHRFTSLQEQMNMWSLASKKAGELIRHVGCSIGVKGEDYRNANTLVRAGCSILCIDVAHGDHILAVQMVERIAKGFPDVLLIAGNVATASGARRLYNAGADVIKVGIGPGSLCTTRIETGNGVPQITALHDVFQESSTVDLGDIQYQDYSLEEIEDLQRKTNALNRKFKIIADGGIREAGDCAKALVFADAVMLGSMLAGTDEAPGEIEVDVASGRRFKTYAGSSTHKANRVEGVVRRIPCKGPVSTILTKIKEGIQSNLSYQGCTNLEEFKEVAEFIQISGAGLAESHPHTY